MASHDGRTQTVLGVTPAGGGPSRVALYQPLLRRAVAVEWEMARARLASGAGEAVIGVVSREEERCFGEDAGAFPRPARLVPLEPHLALFYAGLHDGILDTRAQGTFAFVEWDAHGLDVCVVEIRAGSARLLARAGAAALSTVALSEQVGAVVVLPAATGVSSAALWSGPGEGERRRIVAAGAHLLRRCWAGGRERFSCVLPPMPGVRALARGAVTTVERDDILAQCRLALTDAADLLHGALEAGRVAAGTPVRIIVSGEVARWQELHAALGGLPGVAAVTTPAEPECFAARGAAVAAAREAGVLAARP